MICILNEQYNLELNLPVKEDMTRKEFFRFCEANDQWRIERDENNQIYIMAPVGGDTGRKHIKIVHFLETWNSQNQAGVVFDSSTGFDLPDGSTRSPDAAWIKKEKWDKLTAKQKDFFIPFAPDFAVEVLSRTDKIAPTQLKMNKWIKNGVKLGWLIAPKKQVVYIYRADGTIDKVEGFGKKLSGENVLPGFEFDLSVLL